MEETKDPSLKGEGIELESKLVVRRSTVKNAPDDWILVDW
jgi:hypothetical protein